MADAAFDPGRALRHLLSTRASVRRHFPAAAMAAIEQAVKDCEAEHPGEIRFAVEGGLDFASALSGISARDRALEVFSDLQVWDTEHNNGVLIYVLLADRRVEIVADRGVAGGRVPQSAWDACCRVIESAFRIGDFAGGGVAGVRAVAAVLAQYPPTATAASPAFCADPGNELPDTPVIL